MDLAYLATNAKSSRRMRARIQKNGVNARGDRLWEGREDEIVRDLYPDYIAICRALRHRTYDACRSRAMTLGVANKRHHWTAREISLLRKIYPKFPREQILACFEGLSWDQISGRANGNGIYRHKAPFARTGTLVIDQIRDRCRALNYTMADLDKLARSKTYFSKAGWLRGNINHRAIGRAVRALFGDLHADWS